MTSITTQYVEQVIRTSLKDFDEQTVQATKMAFIDTVGCILAGSRSPIGKVAMNILGNIGGKPEATVLGDGRRLPAPITAFITGQFAVGPDLSDNYKPGTIIISHPGEGIVPAVLALAEKTGASLGDVFLAMILGYETAGRYATAIEPRRSEVYSFSTHYTLAAAIACASLLNLSENQTINALGIAGTMAPLPATMAMWGFREAQRPASWHRDLPGHACFAGILGCLFAQTDFKATHLLLDPETEYFKIAGSDTYDSECLFKDWGTRYVIDHITFKSIPSCYFNQPCIEALRILIEESPLKLETIERIEIHAPTNFAKNFIHYPPKTSVDTASSVKYLTAMYLLTRNPGPDWYLDFEKYLASPAYQSIAAKIEVRMADDLQKILEEENKLLGRARIQTKTQEYEKTVSFVKGSPENPFTMSDIETKFCLLATPIIGEERAEKFLDVVNGFDEEQDIREILPYLY